MKKMHFHFQTSLSFSEVISAHSFSLRCMPVEEPGQKLLYCEVTTEPPGIKLNSHQDSFGNQVLTGYYADRHSQFTFHVEGEVVREIPEIVQNQVPDEAGRCRQAQEQEFDEADRYQQNIVADMRQKRIVRMTGNLLPCYRYFSALTTPGDAVRALHEKCIREINCAMQDQLPDNVKSGPLLDQIVWEMSHQVYSAMTYRKYATDISTTGESALANGQGVCQDYAHILLTLLRMEKISCRYVAGLAEHEGETHGWVEYYHPEKGWTGIDPTNDCMAGENYIKLSQGRDFNDCSINRGMFYGGGIQTQTVTSAVEEIV